MSDNQASMQINQPTIQNEEAIEGEKLLMEVQLHQVAFVTDQDDSALAIVFGDKDFIEIMVKNDVKISFSPEEVENGEAIVEDFAFKVFPILILAGASIMPDPSYERTYDILTYNKEVLLQNIQIIFDNIKKENEKDAYSALKA